MLGGIGGDDLRARRDHAIICVLIGCGLRRAELAALEMENVQTLSGRRRFRDDAHHNLRLAAGPHIRF
jgi:site-specific recombinase XerC